MTLLSLNSLNLSLPGRDNRGRSSEPMMRAPIRGVPQNLKEGSGSQRFQGWWFRVGSSVLGVGMFRSCEKTGRFGDITPGSRFLVA